MRRRRARTSEPQRVLSPDHRTRPTTYCRYGRRSSTPKALYNTAQGRAAHPGFTSRETLEPRRGSTEWTHDWRFDRCNPFGVMKSIGDRTHACAARPWAVVWNRFAVKNGATSAPLAETLSTNAGYKAPATSGAFHRHNRVNRDARPKSCRSPDGGKTGGAGIVVPGVNAWAT